MPRINVLAALTGFKKSGGATDQAAAVWASAHLSEGEQLAQEALDANSDPRAGQVAALSALKTLANS